MMNAKSSLSKKGAVLLAVLASPLLLAACVHSAPPKPAEGDAGMKAWCPMTVPGTQVYAADTEDGSALTFTTAPAEVAELRIRVHAMASMHNQRHEGAGGDERMGGMKRPPPSRAWVQDVENGARLSMTPNAPADLPALRSAVRGHAEHLQRHGCGMWAQ